METNQNLIASVTHSDFWSKNYSKLNNIIGWIVFAIACTVYFLTIEPTASWWDCGEFISSAFKLEVGHPPGAPFFMLLGRIFTLFAFGDVTKVALMVNSLSAIASAFSVLFLFWSITMIAKKAFAEQRLPAVANSQTNEASLSAEKVIIILISGFIGALAFTFCDSFWFSAVEGEVYALSTFFTAIVFWAMLKWEKSATGGQNPRSNDKWLILIAYLIGLSIGVHLLNLLAIPALAYIFYYKKYKPSKKGFILTGIIGASILFAIQSIIIPGIVKIASKFELLFVNDFGLPFGSGVIFFAILLISLIIWGIRYSIKKQNVVLNTIILCITVIILGYSSYAVILIRSSANPPLDENDPQDVFSLLAYLNREQYGDRPLLYGQQFTAELEDQKNGDPVWIKGKNKYERAGYKLVNIWSKEHCTLFPRMYSSEGSHKRAYMEWSGCDDKKRPTMAENLKFLFKYQIGHMYLRYFMWNFVGRQNDIQGHGAILNGNWLSGIPFIDARLGDQSKISSTMTNNQARNKFYFLPLILGLIGLFYHLNKNSKDTFIVFLLFFTTGIAIILYLNQYPYQPRERDYAYAGSFMAFCIWIGLGVCGIYDFLIRKIKIPSKISIILAIILGLFMAPYLMAKDGWDDHCRAKKYACRDFAANYLNSCAPNAILFTNGDNDTFPLWYAQEVEGIRTDVRVVNLALLAGDWYIAQMRKKVYDSEPLPISLPEKTYKPGVNDYIPFYEKENIQGYVDIKKLLNFVGSDDERTKLVTRRGNKVSYFPTKNSSLLVDSAKVIKNGIVRKENAKDIVPAINWTVNKSYLGKYELIVLDIISTSNWDRPIYFVAPHSVKNYLNMMDYFQQEGLTYRLVPVQAKVKDGGIGFVNTDVMYDNVMNKFKWGNIADPSVYVDPETMRMTDVYRNNFARLAGSLLREGKKEKALAVLDKCMQVIPENKVPYNIYILPIIESYYKADAIEKAIEITKKLADETEENLNFYFSLGPLISNIPDDVREAMAIFQRLVLLTETFNQVELNKDLTERFAILQGKYITSGISGK